MDIKERLLIFIKALGITTAEFERVCGLSNGFVKNTNDRIRKASLKLISDAYPRLSMDWVINGEGDMMLPEEKTPTTVNDLIKVVTKLVEQNAVNAEANKANAQAIERLSNNLERILSVIGDDTQIEKSNVG